MHAEVEYLFQLVNAGLLTHAELPSKLLHLAATKEPEDVLRGVPVWVAERLRDICSRGSGDSLRFYPTWGCGVDPDEAMDRYDAEAEAGLQRLRGYFAIRAVDETMDESASARQPATNEGPFRNPELMRAAQQDDED
ncbi:MAG: hypothetical protein RMA76_31205 [Deltaproteobacteria bacterium]|jgi:hypothetical protein